MTLEACINMVDGLKPNRFTKAQKVQWLSEIDGEIAREVLLTHEDIPQGAEDFSGYDPDTDDDTELLAPFPHDMLYRWYLESQIDLYNAELGKYNNSRELFNNAYLTYRNAYNRAHMPLSKATHIKL